jgi:hypothetical protein
MKFSTEAISEMAEIRVEGMKEIGLDREGIGGGETGMRGFLREVGVKALGSYLEQKDEQIQGAEKVYECGGQRNYLFKRKATILSVFGCVSYRRSYHV